MIELVEKLRLGGVEVYRARQAFSENGETWPEGTYVIPLTQVFGRYAKDLLEVQMYPAGQRAVLRRPHPTDLTMYPPGPWACSSASRRFSRMSLCPANLPLDSVTQKLNYVVAVERSGANLRFPYTGARSAVVVNRLLKAGVR